MKKLIPFWGVLLVMVFGCVLPTSQVITVDDRPGLIIKNAPSNSVLIVDGIDVGAADQFDGNPNFLVLRPGKHHIEIHNGGGHDPVHGCFSWGRD